MKNRSQVRVQRIITDFKNCLPRLKLAPLESLNLWGKSNGLIINCTPVGTRDTKSPWPEELPFPEKSIVMDLIYRETNLLRKAKREGLLAFDGLEMLVQQAALSFSMWTNQKPPIAEMKTK